MPDSSNSKSSGNRTLPPKVLGPSVIALAVQALQILLGIIAVPVLLAKLGSEKYGALSLLWVLPSLLPLFDLGLSRALASIAVHERDARHSGRMLLSSLMLQALIWVFCALIFWVLPLTHVFPDSFLKFTDELDTLNKTVFLFLASCIALSMINIISAYLQARGRLYSLLIISSLASLTVGLIPMIAFFVHPTLELIARYTFWARFLCLLIGGIWVGCLLASEGWAGKVSGMGGDLKRLIGRAPAAGVYFILSPLLVFGDRYLFSYIDPSSSVVPHLIAVDLGIKFLIVPSLLGQYSFRLISKMEAEGAKLDQIAKYYLRAMIFLYVLPLCLAVFFAKELIHVWLGGEHVSAVSVICIQSVLIAVATVAVSSFLVQASIGANKMARLSKMAIVEFCGGIVILIALIRFRPAFLDAAILLSLFWSLRVIIEAWWMLRVTRPFFGTSVMQKFTYTSIGIMISIALVAGLIDVLTSSSQVLMKIIILMMVSSSVVAMHFMGRKT